MSFVWTGRYPVRLLITVTGEPDRAVVVEGPDDADRLWAAWCRLRYARGKLLGGSVTERAIRCACGRWVRWVIGRCEPSCRIKERKAS